MRDAIARAATERELRLCYGRKIGSVGTLRLRASHLIPHVEDGLPRLKIGLDKVTDPEEIAMHRHELDDDTWGAPADAPDRIEWPTNMAAPTATATAANCAAHE